MTWSGVLWRPGPLRPVATTTGELRPTRGLARFAPRQFRLDHAPNRLPHHRPLLFRRLDTLLAPRLDLPDPPDDSQHVNHLLPVLPGLPGRRQQPVHARQQDPSPRNPVPGGQPQRQP